MHIIEVYNYVTKFDIKQSMLGFEYLMSAIELGLNDEKKLRKITSLYEEIAESFAATPSCVERSIRYAIGDTALNNKEFICKAVNELKYQDICAGGSGRWESPYKE